MKRATYKATLVHTHRNSGKMVNVTVNRERKKEERERERAHKMHMDRVNGLQAETREQKAREREKKGQNGSEFINEPKECAK